MPHRSRILSATEELERERRIHQLRFDSDTQAPKPLEERVDYLEEAHLDGVNHDLTTLARLERAEEELRIVKQGNEEARHEFKLLAHSAISAVGDSEKRIAGQVARVAAKQWKPRDYILIASAVAAAVTSVIGALAHH